MITIKKCDIKRDRYYNLNNNFKLLYVGRLEERKGIKEIVLIASELKNRNIKFTIDVIGSGDFHEETISMISSMDLNENVIIHGFISDETKLKKFYNQANAFIFPSHDEGFPRVIYEAMSTGLPIFTTFVGGIPGRMKDQFNCIEIPVRNGIVAGKIIAKYLKSPNILESIGQQGLKCLIEIIDQKNKDHDKLVEQYIKIDY